MPRIPRDAEPLLRVLAQEYPVVAITGPRQSGKTSLARHLFPDHAYRNLERPDLRQFASSDPRGFLSELGGGAVIDEVQRVPELLSWLQDLVDQNPQPGRFVITGSQQFGLRSGISQSLAGRVGLLELLPFSAHELSGGGKLPADSRPRPGCPALVWQLRGHLSGAGRAGADQRA